jgi:hypothetical protein
MSQEPDEPTTREQELLRHARREGLLIMAVWAAALVWSVGSGYFLGYTRQPPDVALSQPQHVALILGIPVWVFWSVVLPWGACLIFSAWFCFAYMADDDLGHDPEEGDDRG